MGKTKQGLREAVRKRSKDGKPRAERAYSILQYHKHTKYVGLPPRKLASISALFAKATTRHVALFFQAH